MPSLSDAEFLGKLRLCAQEADETQLSLELLQQYFGVASDAVQPLWQEADELIRICVTMSKNTKARLKARASA